MGVLVACGYMKYDGGGGESTLGRLELVVGFRAFG